MLTKKKQANNTKKPEVKETSLEQGNTDQLLIMITETAYYKAESRGFIPGHEIEDWLEAEKEVKSGLDNS